MLRFVPKAACAVLLAACLALPAQAAQLVDRIVAVVNGQIITQYDLSNRLKPILTDLRARRADVSDDRQVQAVQKSLLEKMINDMLVLDEAKRMGVQISDADVDNHIRKVKKDNNLSEEDLLRQLRLEGLTRKEYEQSVREDLLRFRLLQTMVSRKVLVTDEEIQAAYEKDKGRTVSRGKAVELAVVLLPADADAAGLAEKLRSGRIGFDDAVREHSIGPGKDEGGRLGALRWNELSPEWRQAVEGLKEGEVSKPIEVGGRKAILKLLKQTTAAEDPGLDAERERIRQQLHQPKFEKQYEEFLARLREKAIIDIRL